MKQSFLHSYHNNLLSILPNHPAHLRLYNSITNNLLIKSFNKLENFFLPKNSLQNFHSNIFTPKFIKTEYFQLLNNINNNINKYKYKKFEKELETLNVDINKLRVDNIRKEKNKNKNKNKNKIEFEIFGVIPLSNTNNNYNMKVFRGECEIIYEILKKEKKLTDFNYKF